VVEPVATANVPPTQVGAAAAASTAIADWPHPAPAPGIVFVSVFLLLAACPMLLLLPVWHSPAADAQDHGNGGSDGVLGRLAPFVVNSLQMELVRIAPGTFRMGSDPDAGRADEIPAHEVKLTRPFYLGKHEVTQAQFEQVMGTNPSHFTDERGGGPDFPVESVTWHEADEFCRRLSALPEEKAAGRRYRLPTEAEWEYACRAGTTTPFAGGETLSGAVANFDCTFPAGDAPPSEAARQRPVSVGSFPPNPWGLYDMHGNVWEWCADWSSPYPDAAGVRVNPQGPALGSGKIVRGGGWCSYGWLCRSATRFSMAPARRARDIGFRVAMTLDRP
jgi:formylglycine-generating enzyme required for sulfatase activity